MNHKIGDLEGALKDYEKALRINPNFKEAQNNLKKQEINKILIRQNS